MGSGAWPHGGDSRRGECPWAQRHWHLAPAPRSPHLDWASPALRPPLSAPAPGSRTRQAQAPSCWKHSLVLPVGSGPAQLPWPDKPVRGQGHAPAFWAVGRGIPRSTGRPARGLRESHWHFLLRWRASAETWTATGPMASSAGALHPGPGGHAGPGWLRLCPFRSWCRPWRPCLDSRVLSHILWCPGPMPGLCSGAHLAAPRTLPDVLSSWVRAGQGALPA